MPRAVSTPKAVPDVVQGGMNRRHAVGLFAMSAAFVGSTTIAGGQAVQLVTVDVKTVGEGFQTSQLVGTSVQNDKGEEIGTLDDLIITKDKKLFGILEVGGFLGLGAHLIAVPYESLKISDDGSISLAGASQEAVKKLPEFEYKK